MKTLACPLCRRAGYLNRDTVIAHLADDHAPRAVADELMRRVYPAKCGKKCYPDRVAAECALLSTWRSRSPNRHEARAYHCDACSAWHLTSKPADEVRPTAEETIR